MVLTKDTTWVENAPNQRELFCLDYISSYLDSVQVVNGSFEWVSRCEKDESVVLSVLSIYSNYITKSKGQEMPFMEPNSAAMKLFQWVSNIDSFLVTWKEKFTQSLVTYDQIVQYKHHLRILQSMSSCMILEENVCSEQEVRELKHQYERQFKELNSLLLKPVPGDGNRKT